MNSLAKRICVSLLLIPHLSSAIDNHHFYRASNFFPIYEMPRLEECWLSSLDIFFGGGSTKCSRNGPGIAFNECNRQNCLLNICGYANMPALACNLPNLNLSNPVDLALYNLSQLESCVSPRQNPLDTFGMLSYAGKFSLLEANFFFTQNFSHGIFFQAHLPVRHLKIEDVHQADLSPTGNVFPNINTPQWQTFLGLFPDMLQRYSLSLCPVSRTGIGDFSTLLGWTTNYENTEILDFIDMTIRGGILYPTAKKANPDCVFDIPLGYNGHFGIPLSFDLALGAFECFTLGMHIMAMPFLDKIQCVRVETAPVQSGLIKLLSSKAKVHEGILWDGTGYMYADHIFCGFSFLLGFSYAHKNPSTISTGLCNCDGSITNLTSPNTTLLPNSSYCINCDLANGSWTMQTVHVLFEYDFESYCHPFDAHIGLFYNGPVGGRKIFKTGMVGFTLGFDWGYIDSDWF